jgi:hypothetical protein
MKRRQNMGRAKTAKQKLSFARFAAFARHF